MPSAAFFYWTLQKLMPKLLSCTITAAAGTGNFSDTYTWMTALDAGCCTNTSFPWMRLSLHILHIFPIYIMKYNLKGFKTGPPTLTPAWLVSAQELTRVSRAESRSTQRELCSRRNGCYAADASVSHRDASTPPSHWRKLNHVSLKIRRLVRLSLSLSSFSFHFDFGALLSALSRRLSFISLVTRNSRAEFFPYLFSISFSFSFYYLSLSPFFSPWGIPWLKEDELSCYCCQHLPQCVLTLLGTVLSPRPPPLWGRGHRKATGDRRWFWVIVVL